MTLHRDSHTGSGLSEVPLQHRIRRDRRRSMRESSIWRGSCAKGRLRIQSNLQLSHSWRSSWAPPEFPLSPLTSAAAPPELSLRLVGAQTPSVQTVKIISAADYERMAEMEQTKIRK